MTPLDFSALRTKIAAIPCSDPSCPGLHQHLEELYALVFHLLVDIRLANTPLTTRNHKTVAHNHKTIKPPSFTDLLGDL